jgi:hypothetical protein
MLAYQAELARVRDQLDLMDAAYRRNESDNSTIWGQM